MIAESRSSRNATRPLFDGVLFQNSAERKGQRPHQLSGPRSACRGSGPRLFGTGWPRPSSGSKGFQNPTSRPRRDRGGHAKGPANTRSWRRLSFGTGRRPPLVPKSAYIPDRTDEPASPIPSLFVSLLGRISCRFQCLSTCKLPVPSPLSRRVWRRITGFMRNGGLTDRSPDKREVGSRPR